MKMLQIRKDLSSPLAPNDSPDRYLSQSSSLTLTLVLHRKERNQDSPHSRSCLLLSPHSNN